ncbi:hypothetical protein [Aeromonas salmonicida]|uniref:hypothetical protein n=1 Tax=Aeromonas salmonicida TaxID=645 RepID=UPI002115D236|nr:hypothetical protein [Aeromonas salmonicida]UUI58949.1 hypothetical protein NP805_12080 [Aeromonas salmonicida]
MKVTGYGIALLVWLLAVGAQAANCTYQKNSLGQVRYRCDDGRQGTLRTDSLGRVRDSGTGQQWRQDANGTWRSNDGQTRREDALGRIRQSDGTVWRTDAQGKQKASDGTVCRTDSLNRTQCRGGDSKPPSLLPAKKK